MLGKIRRHARHHDYMMDIIAHPTKIMKDPKTKRYMVPTLYDINGSANWYNKTDNGFCTYRHFGNPQPVPNVEFHIQKIKFKIHGEVGVVQFNYDRESGRLIEHDTYQEEMEF
jgi:twinkle protein